MHAELMEFNQYLQQKLQEYESISSLEVLDYPESNVKVHIPSAFLVGKKTQSYHVYQVNIPIKYLIYLPRLVRIRSQRRAYP